MPKTSTNKTRPKRNDALFDAWSVVHFVTSAVLAAVLDPIVAFIIVTAWEPIEIFIISPILARFGIEFGYESLQNSLSDIAFNTAGILFVLLLTRLT